MVLSIVCVLATSDNSSLADVVPASLVCAATFSDPRSLVAPVTLSEILSEARSEARSELLSLIFSEALSLAFSEIFSLALSLTRSLSFSRSLALSSFLLVSDSTDRIITDSLLTIFSSVVNTRSSSAPPAANTSFCVNAAPPITVPIAAKPLSKAFC